MFYMHAYLIAIANANLFTTHFQQGLHVSPLKLPVRGYFYPLGS